MKPRPSLFRNASQACLFVIIIAVAVAPVCWGQAPPEAAPANPVAPPSEPVKRTEAELEKLVAPIALYPDPLLATLLPASAYPIEIVQAARFVKDTNNISKLDSQPWDENVKALARFPEVMAKMNEDIAWTSELGQAFVEDQKGVLNAIQVMRGKAQQAGSLKTTPQQVVVVTNSVTEKTVEQQVVVVTNTIVQIQPAQPEVIYVPQYNPTVVYEQHSTETVVAASVISFGVGMAVGAIIANNDCDWHSGGVYVHGGGVWAGGYHGNVNVNRNVNVNQNVNVNRGANVRQSANVSRAGSANAKWQADSNRRVSRPPATTPQARGWSAPAQTAARAPAVSGSGRSAFNNSGGGAQARQASARGGASSRGGFSRGGGGGGGRGRR